MGETMSLSLRGVHKSFPGREAGTHVPVLDGIDLDVRNGRIASLFGPNGCGKTTILNLIAGMDTPNAGTVAVADCAPGRQGVGFVFQNFRDMLLPWESAVDNVAFGLRASGVVRSVAHEEATRFLDGRGFNFPRQNYPYQLSAGQQQAVALARVLIMNPANLLLDESFAAFDHTARLQMQNLLVSLVEEAKLAVLLVSHDIDEALFVSDDLYLLGKRPARVIRHFRVDFPRPRGQELLASAEFSALRRQVVSAFLAEVGP